MKRLVLLCTILLTSLFVTAQTQQGYVKTKGRMVDGQIVHGQGLPGATVSIKGRTTILVNSDDGAFSFPVTDSQFRVDSVRKKGYRLVDVDAMDKTYTYSPNPVYLVMETPEQQLQDQLSAERKIRRTLTNQLHQRENEIEALKEQQKISDEEYRRALQKLYEETNQNDQLVKDMVERYSKIDYDQLSEFDQKISEYILNGELTKADSLLRTKGDINLRMSEYRRHEAINAKEREELSQRQDLLEQSEVLAIQERDDLANDCYRKFEIFKMQHLNDSAAYYLELRVGLDTTNVEWLSQTGLFFREYLADFERTLYYYQLGLRQSIAQNGKQNESTISFYNNIGLLYSNQGDFNKAMEYYEIALAVQMSVQENNGFDLASIYNNIGAYFFNQGIFKKASEFFDMALSELHTIMVSDPSIVWERVEDIATIYNNIGAIYEKEDSNYEKAMEYHVQALNTCVSALGKNNPTAALSYNYIGTTYYFLGDFSKALENYEQAMSIQRIIFGDVHPDLAATYNNIGMICFTYSQYEQALVYYSKALNIWRSVVGEKHPDVATCYQNIGIVLNRQGNYDEALNYYDIALKTIISTYGKNHPAAATCYIHIGIAYENKQDFETALEWFNKALDIRETYLGKDHIETADCYRVLGDIYSDLGDQQKAADYLNKALVIISNTMGENHIKLAGLHNSIGFVYFNLGEIDNSLMHFEKALRIAENTYGSNNSDVASAYHNIGYILNIKGEHEKALEHLNKALSIRLTIFNSEHPSVAESYHCIGNVYADQGDYYKALEFYNKTLVIREKIFDEDHPSFILIKNKISEIQAKLSEQENKN